LAEVDSAELSEWLAYEQAYGLPDGYFVTGQTCAVAAAAAGAKRPNPADFVPYFRDQKRLIRQSTDQMLSMFGGWAERHNERIRRDGG
jgi:hypothetical protein